MRLTDPVKRGLLRVCASEAQSLFAKNWAPLLSKERLHRGLQKRERTPNDKHTRLMDDFDGSGNNTYQNVEYALAWEQLTNAITVGANGFPLSDKVQSMYSFHLNNLTQFLLLPDLIFILQQC